MVDTKKLIEILTAIAHMIEDNKDFLSDLDNVIGDGDHGINMARGFGEVLKKLPSFEDKDAGAILKMVGTTLVSTVGGASGPLYGTAFMKSGGAVDKKTEISFEDFINILNVSIEGIKMRGKSTQGEKTMLDALIPAYDVLKAAFEAGEPDVKAAFESALKAAKDGVEYTKTIIATKGRASYLGERSLGHQDPGATSFTLMLEVIYNQLTQ